MNQTTIADRVYSSIVLLTPAVKQAISEVSSMLSQPSPSLTFITAKPGAGLSTVVRGLLEHFDLHNHSTIVLARGGLELDLLPSQMLLHNYGFESLTGGHGYSAKNPINNSVANLIKMVCPRAIIVDDYLNGVVKTADRKKHIDIWRRLARPPFSLSVILAGQSTRVNLGEVESDKQYQIFVIREWSADALFTRYLDEISQIAETHFGIYMNLASHATELFAASGGNTGELIERIRQCAINLILTGRNNLASELISRPMKEIVLSNARLYIASPFSR